MECKNCEIKGCPNRGSNAVFSKPCTIINQDSFDWQSFRAEAAKDILCASLSGGIASGMIDMIAIIQEKETIVSGSIEIADELINQLKEKKK